MFNIEIKPVPRSTPTLLCRNHFHVRGDTIEKTGENTYVVDKPSATTCDGSDPTGNAGSEMKVTIEGYGLMKNACFKVGASPALFSVHLFRLKPSGKPVFCCPIWRIPAIKTASTWSFLFLGRFARMDATFYQRFIEKEDSKKGRNSDMTSAINPWHVLRRLSGGYQAGDGNGG